MPDLLRRPPLMDEAPPQGFVSNERLLQDLERDRLAVGIPDSTEDDPHAALSEHLLETVRASRPPT